MREVSLTTWKQRLVLADDFSKQTFMFTVTISYAIDKDFCSRRRYGPNVCTIWCLCHKAWQRLSIITRTDKSTAQFSQVPSEINKSVSQLYRRFAVNTFTDTYLPHARKKKGNNINVTCTDFSKVLLVDHKHIRLGLRCSIEHIHIGSIGV